MDKIRTTKDLYCNTYWNIIRLKTVCRKIKTLYQHSEDKLTEMRMRGRYGENYTRYYPGISRVLENMKEYTENYGHMLDLEWVYDYKYYDDNNPFADKYMTESIKSLTNRCYAKNRSKHYD